jgi:predicted metal-binding membrane protein
MTTAPEQLAGPSQRDRLLLGTLLLPAVVAWCYIVYLAATMPAHAAMAMPDSSSWRVSKVGWLASMWVVMMIAMMLPSVVPVILAFDRTTRRYGGHPGSTARTAAFTSGYLLIWAAYGTLAAVAHSALSSAGLLTPAMRSASPVLGGVLLLAVGIYQWLPLKAGCLEHCRMPVMRSAGHRRAGAALREGLKHGLICVGCCGVLMLLLFVAGVMNLLWVVAIAAFVAMEKLARGGPVFGMIAGAILAAWGVWVVVAS